MALQQGKGQAATDLFADVIRLAGPNASDVIYLNYGMALHTVGRLADAADSLRQAVKLRPDTVAAHWRLGIVLEQMGRLEDALASYQKTVALQPQHVDAWGRLGVAQQRLGRLDEAEASYRRALALQPRSAQLLSNLGTALQARGALQEAVAVLRQALEYEPGFIMAQCNLGGALLAQGQPEEAVACQRQVLARQPEEAHFYSNLLFGMQYLYKASPQALFNEHRRFARQFEAPFKTQWPPHHNERSPGRRLKVGYVSADFRDHALAFFLQPVLQHHDTSRVEIYCYYNNTVHDAVTARLQAYADHWCSCHELPDAGLAGRIRADGIDILVDLAGHTALNRLPVFARKPAPVQVTWLGYPGTTGLDAMDYRLSDTFLDPPGEADACHSETVVRLPAWAVFNPAPDSPPVNALPALNTGYLTLACLNNLAKVNTTVIRLWARILAVLPTARLLIGNAGGAEIPARLRAQFAEYRVQGARLQFLPKMPLPEFLHLHQQIDLALDPFPFTGGASTCHALWMGVPVITLSGKTTVSRQGEAILQSVGLPECVAHTEEEYLARVLALAADLPRLQAIRLGLRERMASSVTARQLTRALEQAYGDMWERWCRK